MAVSKASEVNDETIKTSYRLKKSTIERIAAYRKKAGYLTDSEAVRVLLSTALDVKDKEENNG